MIPLIPQQLLHLENMLTRQVLVVFRTAVIFGIAAGAFVTMYYDLIPNMGSIEDNLLAVLTSLCAYGGIVSLFHLLLALWDAKIRLGKEPVIARSRAHES